jgi:hypothetical protein
MTRGRKALTDRDWLFGSRPRRLALEALFSAPHQGWSKAALARAAGVSAHGGIDEHVAGLTRLGLLARDGDVFRLADPLPPYAASLERLLADLGTVGD